MNNWTSVGFDRVFELMSILAKLKDTKRAGWVLRHVNEPESVSDHMYRMGLMAMLIDQPNIDRNKCIRMSLCHDIGEAIIGDITPQDGVSDEEKHRIEEAALVSIKNAVGGEIGEEIFALWKEYEEAVTVEGNIVKDIDKLEMLFQARTYEDRKKH
jgi:putative hydrolase of HD superfamily